MEIKKEIANVLTGLYNEILDVKDIEWMNKRILTINDSAYAIVCIINTKIEVPNNWIGININYEEIKTSDDCSGIHRFISVDVDQGQDNISDESRMYSTPVCDYDYLSRDGRDVLIIIAEFDVEKYPYGNWVPKIINEQTGVFYKNNVELHVYSMDVLTTSIEYVKTVDFISYDVTKININRICELLSKF